MADCIADLGKNNMETETPIIKLEPISFATGVSLSERFHYFNHSLPACMDQLDSGFNSPLPKHLLASASLWLENEMNGNGNDYSNVVKEEQPSELPGPRAPKMNTAGICKRRKSGQKSYRKHAKCETKRHDRGRSSRNLRTSNKKAKDRKKRSTEVRHGSFRHAAGTKGKPDKDKWYPTPRNPGFSSPDPTGIEWKARHRRHCSICRNDREGRRRFGSQLGRTYERSQRSFNVKGRYEGTGKGK